MPADLWNNVLVKPPFASNPPLKVNVPAKTYGLVLGILAALGAIFGLIAAISAFTWSSTLNADCNLVNSVYGTTVCQSHSTAIAGLGELVVLVGMVLGAWGGFKMYQGDHQGRPLMVYGLVLAVLGQLVYAIFWGFSYYVAGFIVALIIYAVIYYFIVISRFPDEQPLVAAGAPAGYPPFGGPQQYPPQQYPPQAPPPGQYPPQGPPPPGS